MPRERTLDDRLRAIERSVETDTARTAHPGAARRGESGEGEGSVMGSGGSQSDGSGDLEARVTTLEEQLAELQAGIHAVQGYVGNIEHVNQSVERRANAAIAAVERMEAAPTTPPNLASVATEQSSNPSSEDPTSAADEDESPRSESPSSGLLERVTAHL